MNILDFAKPSVLVITHFTSPYQVELFDSISASEEIYLTVIYLNRKSLGRKWADRKINHPHFFSSDLGGNAPGLKDLVKKSDLVIINYYQSLASLSAISVCQSLEKPIIFWGERPHEHKYSLISRKIRSFIFKGWQSAGLGVWGIGSLAVEKYKSEFGDSYEYVNIPYYSNLSRFANSSDSESVNPLRTRSPVTFLYSGSLNHRKGVDVLAHAFLKLMAEGCKARLVFLGDGELRSALEVLLKDHMSMVEFLGFKDWEDLPGVYANADVLCVPSRHDGWALVVPEGLAAGLPVIATTTTGAAVDLIQQGVNGWLVPPDDVSALASAMSEAASLQVGTLEKMANGAKESVARHQLQDGAALFATAARNAVQRHIRSARR